MEFKIEYVVFGIFAVVALYFLYQIATKGLKGAFFGGKVEKIYGELDIEKTGPIKGRLKVYKISSDSGSMIGIEVVHKSMLSYQMTPVTMSRANVQKLILLLSQAVSET